MNFLKNKKTGNKAIFYLISFFLLIKKLCVKKKKKKFIKLVNTLKPIQIIALSCDMLLLLRKPDTLSL